MGRGVVAVRSFRKGQKIGEINGEATQSPTTGSEYLLDLGWNWCLDPAPPFRFLNHCCEPNCELVAAAPIQRGDPPSLSLIALCRIDAGDEIRNDYSWSAEVSQPCLCGALSCRGWIVDKREAHCIPLRVRKLHTTTRHTPRAHSRTDRSSFQSELFGELAPRYQQLLHSTPDSAKHWFWRSKKRYAHLRGVIAAVRGRELARHLESSMRRHLRPWRVPIPKESISEMTENFGEALQKTVRLKTVFVNGTRSHASQSAQNVGLSAFVQSESFRALGQAVSGFRLLPGADLQLHRYGAGDYVGPHNDHFPEDDPDFTGYIDVQLSLSSSAVSSQHFIHEEKGFLSQSVNVGHAVNLGVYWLPFWHMTTPLRARPGLEKDAYRWVIVASFAIDGRLPIPNS